MLLQEGCSTHACPDCYASWGAQQVLPIFFHTALTCELHCLLAGQARQQGLRHCNNGMPIIAHGLPEEPLELLILQGRDSNVCARQEGASARCANL